MRLSRVGLVDVSRRVAPMSAWASAARMQPTDRLRARFSTFRSREEAGEERAPSESPTGAAQEVGGNDRSLKKTKLDGDSKLGEVLETGFEKLRPVLGVLAEVTTVEDLVGDDVLQAWLLEQASTDAGLMHGFIGRCKAIMIYQQPPPTPIPVQPKTLAEAIRIICPNPPRDRFEKVAPLGNRLFFSQTEDRKKFCRWRSWEAIKSNQVFQTPLVVIDGAPGDGKTHFEWVLANRKHGVLDQELERALEKFQEPDGGSAKDLILGAELKASFDPELTINPRNVFADRSRKAIGVSVTFNHDTLPSGESGHSMVAVRMLYSHFCRGDFGWFVNELEQHGFPNVDEQTAFDLIRAGIDRAFPNENRAVILVVDEVVMSGKDGAVITSLHTLALKDSNDIHIIASIISPKRSQYLESCGRTPLIQISFPPLSGAAVARLVNSLPEKERTLLQLDSFQSLLRDCAGIPRFVEFVCKIACRVAACPGLERGFDDRRVLLAELRNDSNAPFVKFLAERRWNDFCLSTVFAFVGSPGTELEFAL